jgi:4-hydroxy-tetrahydrodipicolinate synthase
MSERDFEGVMVATVTPFTESGEVDEEGVLRIIEFLERSGVDALVPCGTTGESATLSHEEHKRVVELYVENSKIPVIAGTGSNSTAEAIDLTKHAKEVGATAAMLVTPYYNKPTQRGLIKHFSTIAREVEGFPLILYNIPSRTGVNMSPETIAELAKIENIIGVKDSTGDMKHISAVFELTENLDFRIYSGDDHLTLPILALGGSGVISVAANIVPKKMVELYRSFKEGNLKKAREIHYELLPLFNALFVETNPIPVKKAVELIGLASSRMRLPMCEMSEENERILRDVMKELGLI